MKQENYEEAINDVITASNLRGETWNLIELTDQPKEDGSFPLLYVSDMGRFMSMRGHVLAQTTNIFGYKMVRANNKTYSASRLVAYAFGLMPELIHRNGMDIDHLNKIRDDNRVCNLEYVTHQENINRRDENGNARCRMVEAYKDGTRIGCFRSINECVRHMRKIGYESVNAGNIVHFIKGRYKFKTGKLQGISFKYYNGEE